MAPAMARATWTASVLLFAISSAVVRGRMLTESLRWVTTVQLHHTARVGRALITTRSFHGTCLVFVFQLGARNHTCYATHTLGVGCHWHYKLHTCTASSHRDWSCDRTTQQCFGRLSDTSHVNDQTSISAVASLRFNPSTVCLSVAALALLWKKHCRKRLTARSMQQQSVHSSLCSCPQVDSG